MQMFLLGLILLGFPVFAETVEFPHDREGKSFYSDKRAVRKALKQIDSSGIKRAFSDTVSELEVNKLCSFDVNKKFLQNLKELNPEFSELKGAIIHIRAENEIDDPVAGLLLTANDTVTTRLDLPKKKEKLFLPSNKKTVAEALKILGSLGKKLEKTCFDEVYRSLYADVLRLDKGMKDYHFEAILVEAFTTRTISFETYLDLEKARVNELHKSTFTLKAYYKKMQSLRNQFPLRDPLEKSNFITKKASKMKVSWRQRLVENYTDIQIMLMANVIKKLRTRVESTKAEILIYDRNQNVETIVLDPMERFRLAVKLLRKEMSLLALNTYFNGRSPDYMDLMSAAYEVGMIPASELEEVAGLEDIWNPKKSFWDKASVWVRTLSSVATIAIPPPYGFIPALAVVVIEMTAGKKDNNTEDPTVLF